jgi:S1-C subfamily serine protease
MKLCPTCDQPLAEGVSICPSCGSEVGEGRLFIDDYRIVDVLHEGHASLLCHAVRERTGEEVMIRLFTPDSGVNQEIADRLSREIEQLKRLPEKGFVKHYAMRRSSDGLWYRISEWVDAENWGELVRSGMFSDYRVAINLFQKITSTLAILHQNGHLIPHLILDDIMVTMSPKGEWDVKIDYKLSRFLDPRLDRPGPMLKHLLDSHPDIINHRPLDARSDIWSLGKIFIELLTADFESYNYLAKIDQLPLPNELKTLFKIMLANEPYLRPRSMNEVAETLSQITDCQLRTAQKTTLERGAIPEKTITLLKKRQMALVIVLIFLGLAMIAGWMHLYFKKQDSADILEGYANKYARSVAFVLVEYWLKTGETVRFIEHSEGTAFLVDSAGYLLTNRHVACPWLEDNEFFLAVYQMKRSNMDPVFGYRMFLWFEGEKAFNRSAGLMDQADLSDQYALGTAFRSDGSPHLTIVGVAKPLFQTRQIVASPLKDDFAVLKIDQVPANRKPLPIDLQMDPKKIPKLAPVITLGFPLGSQTQEATVNVSVGRGHVRRSFEDLLQVDASLYGGNSGGPLIDMNGKVIGIVSGVAMDRSGGVVDPTGSVMSMGKPVWDMAMVLPITKAAGFLQDIKNGQAKWNGSLDLASDAKNKEIMDLAQKRHWAAAMKLADKTLGKSLEPSLMTIGAMMHFYAGDYPGAKKLFQECVSMEVEKELSQLMLFVIDWQNGYAKDNPHLKELLNLDWSSQAEFLGYLGRLLDGLVPEEEALKSWESLDEKSWIYYIAGLLRAKKGDWTKAEKYLQESVLASNGNTWEYFLALVKLEEVQKKRLDALQNDQKQWSACQSEIAAFDQKIKQDQWIKQQQNQALNELAAQLDNKNNLREKREVLERIFKILPDNGEVMLELAFYYAMEESWDKALEFTQNYLKRGGRESSTRLRMSLLEASLVYKMGNSEEATALLEKYYARTRNAWYRNISECLLGKKIEDILEQEAGESPEKLLTAHVALGFWNEGAGEKEKAIEHYKEALESFMDNWVEFNFAKTRISKLRQK